MSSAYDVFVAYYNNLLLLIDASRIKDSLKTDLLKKEIQHCPEWVRRSKSNSNVFYKQLVVHLVSHKLHFDSIFTICIKL